MNCRKFLLFVSAFVTLWGSVALAQPSSAETYPTLLAKVKNGDTSIDFKALRIAYTKTPLYSPYGEDDNTALMFRALNEKAYSKVLEYARLIHEKNFTDMDAHFASRIACGELGDQKCYEFHRTALVNLIDSIMNSGNGATPESALQVITTREEYIILNVLQLKPKQQKLQQVGNKAYDVFEVLDPENNQTLILYFDVTIPYNWLNESLQKK